MPAQECEFLAHSSPPSSGAVARNTADGRRNVTSVCDNSVANAGPIAPQNGAAQRLSPLSLQKQADKPDDPSSSKFRGVMSCSSMLVDQAGKKDSTPNPSSAQVDNSDDDDDNSLLLDSSRSASSPCCRSADDRACAAAAVSDAEAASSSETDDCSQTSSNSSESFSESSSEDGGGGHGVPPLGQAAQHAVVRKVDTSMLLLPPVAALADTTTLILFDWDDTLLASTHLANSNYRLDEPEFLPESVTQQLSLLEDAVIDVLDLADTLGTVCIITNAETGWVELSCKKFLPRVMSHVENLPIVSARSTYEPKFPSLPSKWKLEAFSHRIGQLCDETPHSKNVISLGDSHAEREAVRTVTRDLPATVTKSVKFVERPTLEQLLRQLQLVTRCFPRICEMRRDLDLALTVEALPVHACSSSSSSSGSVSV